MEFDFSDLNITTLGGYFDPGVVPAEYRDIPSESLPNAVKEGLGLVSSWDEAVRFFADVGYVLPGQLVSAGTVPVNERWITDEHTDVDIWLNNKSAGERIALAMNLGSNPIAYDLFMGRGLASNPPIGDLIKALEDATGFLRAIDPNLVANTVTTDVEGGMPHISLADVARTFKPKEAAGAPFITRFNVVSAVGKYEGVQVINDGRHWLSIDGTRFALGPNLLPSDDTARAILDFWASVGGIRFTFFALTPEEERRLPALLGVLRYSQPSGRPQFAPRSVKVAHQSVMPPSYNIERGAAPIIAALNAFVKKWAPSSLYLMDHLTLLAHCLREIKDPLPYHLVDNGIRGYQKFYAYATGLPADYAHMNEEARAEGERLLKSFSILTKLEALFKEGMAGGPQRMVDLIRSQGQVGSYKMNIDAKEVMARLNIARDYRNEYKACEDFYHGNTHPGLGFGSPDGTSAHLKICDVQKRLRVPAGTPVTLMGVGRTLAMERAFGPDTEYCDIEVPKGLRGVQIIPANACTLKRSDTGEPLRLADRVYISDAFGGAGMSVAAYYDQIDAICAAGEHRPLAGALKLFISSPVDMGKKIATLACHYESVSYCGVTKGHTGEYFLIFQGRRNTPLRLAPQNSTSQFALFMYMHALRTDIYNYLYTGNTRAGVIDFSPLWRIDDLLERYVGRFVGSPWRRLWNDADLLKFQGRMQRVSKAGKEVMNINLADLADFDTPPPVEGDVEVFSPAPRRDPPTVEDPHWPQNNAIDAAVARQVLISDVATSPPSRSSPPVPIPGPVPRTVRSSPGLPGEEEEPSPVIDASYGTHKYK